jgi:hypothetical protein
MDEEVDAAVADVHIDGRPFKNFLSVEKILT